MVDFGKFVHTPNGKIMMSILLGFGLATLFRSVCKGRDCYNFLAPPLDDIDGKTYEHEGKCFIYNIRNTKCSKDKQIVNFA
jgi:hypothetical protein